MHSFFEIGTSGVGLESLNTNSLIEKSMVDIEMKPMALFILTEGLSLVKISFFWGGPPKSGSYPGRGKNQI